MSAAYYWAMYRQKREEAKKYEKQIKELTEIRRRLQSEFNDDVSGVNSKLSDCIGALQDGIKQVSAAARWEDELEEAKEKRVESDDWLSSAEDALSDEIRVLEQKKREAEEAAERYREMALAAEAVEAAAAASG